MSGFPPTITIQTVTRFDASVAVPGSKSLTNRALLLAALAGQPDIPGESPVRTESGAQSDPASSPRPSPSRLTRVLAADDSAVMLDALNALGFRVVHDADRQTAEVYGAGGTFPAADAELFMGNAGTATRFLAAALTLGHGRGPYRMSGVARMHQRPIHQLVDPLRELGATITYDGEPDCPPLSIGGPDSPSGARGHARDSRDAFESIHLRAAADRTLLARRLASGFSRRSDQSTLHCDDAPSDGTLRR